MKINVFEGARRISLLLQGVWVMGCISLSVFENPYVSLDYETNGPTMPFVQAASSSCLSPDAEESIYGYNLKNGSTVGIDLCFKAMAFPDGQMLVPYKVDEKTGMWWGGGSYSSEVSAYIDHREAQFTLPKEHEDAAIAKVRKARFDKIWSGVKYAAGGWLVIFLLTWVIGWIVRGFFGIPSGKDHRPEPPKEQAKEAAAGSV
jgi:hypothetical protein